MALPLIIFFFLVILGATLFFLGMANNTRVGQGFMVIGGVILILSGALVQINSLELPITTSIIENSGNYSITYKVLDLSDPALFIISNVLLVCGFVSILLALIITIKKINEKKNDEWVV